jgi:sugar-specific transcriptional regulator TrmB
MSERFDSTKIVHYFRQLGFTELDTTIYIHLLRAGLSTVLEISRAVKTGRTMLYPLLRELVDKGIVTEHHHGRSATYTAAHPAALSVIVDKHERTTASLRGNLPSITHELMQLAPSTTTLTEYSSFESFARMIKSCLTPEDDLYILAHSSVLFERWRVIVPTATQQYFLCSYLATTRKVTKFPANRVRHISSAILPIEGVTYSHASGIGYIDTSEKDVFHAIHIQSPALATQWRAMYRVLWRLGKDTAKIDN